MKQLKFLETKRTPHYSLRKFSVGMVSVLLGVTIFGINFTDHSVKAATTESVESSNSSPNSNSQQPSTVVLPTAEQTKGINSIGAVKVPSLTDSQNDANKAIDDALNNKKSEINGATNIDQPTKDNLIKEATDAATKAKDAIDKAKTNNDVATEQTKGTKAIDAVKVPSLTDSQTAAKQAIDQAAKTKDAAIDASNLTAEEKDALKKTVAGEVQTANTAIDAATKDADVESAKNTGVGKINNINVTSATKDAAKKAIDDALNTKTSEINGATNLDQPTKDKLIQDATDAATEQTKGIKAIDAVKVPSLTDSQTAAKKAIDDALNGIPVKSNSVDDQDNSATNEGSGNQAGHIQSDNSSDVTKHSSTRQSGNEKTQLPQTGDETQRGAGLVGLALAGLVGLLGSAGFRKKRD